MEVILRFNNFYFVIFCIIEVISILLFIFSMCGLRRISLLFSGDR